MYAVIFLSACVHEYILALAFGYFYPILFLQFAILGCKLGEFILYRISLSLFYI